MALVFGLYLAVGVLGLSVPFTSGNVSPVWPASGVAMAAVLIWGWEIWPGIVLAAFLVNFSTIPSLAAVGIGIGNTASALFGGYLLHRFIGAQLSLSRLREVLGLILAAVGSPIVAASVGVTSLFLTHVQAWDSVVLGESRALWLLQRHSTSRVTCPISRIDGCLLRGFRAHRTLC